MTKYPFIYLNHGEINPESIGKNEEIFIWFKREVSKKEQKLIMKNCPPPLNYVLCWGKQFLYFGSGGDTYDFEVMETYAYEESKLFGEIAEVDLTGGSSANLDDIYQTALEKAIPLYTKALEDWANEVNEIVPIVFFYAPNNPEEPDDWATWSEANIYDTTLPYIKKYLENYPKIFAKENEELRFFGYIYKFLSRYVKTENRNLEDLLKDLEFNFELDGITEPFDRLNSEDSQLQGNSNNLYNVLEKLSPEDRVKHLAKLNPYTQLAYYSSYAAIRKYDLLVNKNPLSLIKKLIKTLPASRKNIVGTYLRFMGENLVHIGPAFKDSEKKDQTHAALAAEILELSFLYANSEEVFTNCAAFYDWQKNYPAMLEVSLKGIKKFPNNSVILANILYSAEKCGKKEIVAKYINQKTDDPMVIANQSYSLVISGKNQEASDLLINHFKNKGTFNEYSLTNLLYICSSYKQPEEKLLKEIIDLSVKNHIENYKYRNVDFMNNLMKLINNTTDYFGAMELFSNYKKLKGPINSSILCGYSYAAIMFGDKQIMKKALDIILYEYEENSAQFETETASYYILMCNISGLYSLLEDKEKMLKFLKLTKKDHPDFTSLKTDPDFKKYWQDPDFLKLFA